MKNRRLIVILSVFLIVTIILVLCSTVFTLHTVDIVWLTTTNNLKNVTNSEIIESGKFNMGESVFLLNKQKYTNNLEKNNPYLKVVNLEIGFPNKLTVKVAEREELYVLKVANSANGNSYVFLDYDLKVLKISNTAIVANEKNPAIVEIENYNLTDSNFSAGTKADLTINSALIGMGNMLLSTGYDSSRTKALIKNVYINYGYKTTISINLSYGLTLEINDALIKTEQKMLKALTLYEWYHNNHPEINSGTITVVEKDSDIIAYGPQVV